MLDNNPVGEASGHDADGLGVVGAAFDHLEAVEPTQLGVDGAGHVGRANELVPEPRVPGLGHRLSIGVGLAGLRGLGIEPDITAERRRLG